MQCHHFFNALTELRLPRKLEKKRKNDNIIAINARGAQSNLSHICIYKPNKKNNHFNTYSNLW